MRTLSNLLTILAVLGISLTTPSNAGESLQGEIQLEYRILLGAFHAGAIRLQASLTASDYELVAWIRSGGLLDLILGFRSRATSSGTFEDGQPAPRRHVAENRWMGNSRMVRNDYDRAGRVTNRAVPDALADGREPVPPASRHGTLDPLSAALRIARAAQGTAPCRGRLAVFDGRRRYDLALTEAAHSDIEGPLYSGTAWSCEVRLDRIVGFSRDPWLPRSDDPETVRIWFGRPRRALPAIPIRLEADAGIAEVQVELMAARLRAPDGRTRFEARVDGWAVPVNDDNNQETPSFPAPGRGR